MAFDQIFKFLGIAWSIVAFVFAAGFFFSDEWKTWQKIKGEHTQYVKSGDKLSVRMDGNLYLYGNPGSGRAETGVILSGSRQQWQVEK